MLKRGSQNYIEFDLPDNINYWPDVRFWEEPKVRHPKGIADAIEF